MPSCPAWPATRCGTRSASSARPVRPEDLMLSLSYDLQRAAVRGLGTAGRGRHARPTDRRDPRAGLEPGTTTPARSPTRPPPNGLRGAPRRPCRAAAPAGDPRPVRAGFGVQDRDRRSPAWVPGAITPETTYAEQPGAEADGLVIDGFRIRDGHHPRRVRGARPHRRDRGVVQHLVCADRRRHGWRSAHRRSRSGWASVRPWTSNSRRRHPRSPVATDRPPAGSRTTSSWRMPPTARARRSSPRCRWPSWRRRSPTMAC